MSAPLPPSASREWIETGEVTLHAITAGPPDGPPVVLLHGFPEFWYGWRHQIPALITAGYRVIVPDQRGYNRSDKPDGVDAYTVDRLADDVLGLIDAFGYDRVRLVGHDWGGAVVWQLLLAEPKRVERAVVMNVPHPAAFSDYFPGRIHQLRRSWYLLAVQAPVIPEWWIRRNDWRGLRWFFRTTTRPEAFSGEVLDRYRSAWKRPGALTGMLNWYRALLRRDPDIPRSAAIDTPVRLVWGMNDSYLHSGMAAASIERCSNGRLTRLEHATHWLHHESPDRINELIRSFFDDSDT